MHRRGRLVLLSTAELQGLNARLLDAGNDCVALSARALDAVSDAVRMRLPELSVTLDAIALLDVTFAFARHVAGCGRPYCRPTFGGADGPLALQNARHPVLEALPKHGPGGTPFVRNSIYLSDLSRLMLIGGPNSGGKTTLLRVVRASRGASACPFLTRRLTTPHPSQVGTCAVLAHAGCYVPADHAQFRSLSRISGRLDHHDSLQGGASSFTADMRTLAAVLSTASPHTLVLFDELGRSTSTTDGTAISWAACERLLSNGCLALFASHCEPLRGLAALYPAAKACVVGARAHTAAPHRLEAAPAAIAAVDRYGIAAAAAAGLPAAVVDDAERLVPALEAVACAMPPPSVTVDRQISVIVQRLRELHQQAAAGAADIDELHAALGALRAQAVALSQQQ